MNEPTSKSSWNRIKREVYRQALGIPTSHIRMLGLESQVHSQFQPHANETPLGATGNGSSSWVLAIHMGNLS